MISDLRSLTLPALHSPLSTLDSRMPDHRKHRGPHPADAELFAERHLPSLREAVADLSWLLTRGYTPVASLKIVGDRFQLTQRQRLAVMRSACSDASLQRRLQNELPRTSISGRMLEIDGFNLLTTIEAALAGGAILIGRDGSVRDLASMHGNYRKVEETRPALELIGKELGSLNAGGCLWLFDKSVSNSGRIGKLTEQLAADNGWDWRFELPDDPDRLLLQSENTVVSADSVIIDGCASWFNLAASVIRSRVPQAWIIDLRSGDNPAAPR
jgi:hypothetical protein